MIIERRSGSDERKIVTACIVDDVVLGRVASNWTKDGRFKTPWANIVVGWAVKYYQTYGKAPSDNIEAQFTKWCERKRDKDQIALIEKFLEQLSGEYARRKKTSQTDYLLDLCDTYFNGVQLDKDIELMRAHRDNGELDKALAIRDKPTRIEMKGVSGIDVLRDKTAWEAAYKAKGEPLIKFKGALGEFFGETLERDAFVSLQGQAKRAKSWWLQHLAWSAMLQGRNVAYFQLGDLSQAQQLRRFGLRAARRPSKACTVQYPIELNHQPMELIADVTHEERVFNDGVSLADSLKACEKVLNKLRTDDITFRLVCRPSGTMKVSGMRSQLQVWEREGWVPDVIVADYADLLCPPTGIIDSRDQINLTWSGLRALSQETHALLLTATQAKATSFDSHTMGRRHFSEDRRKMDHVTAMIGINMTDAEKQLGLCRLNYIQLREGEFVESTCVHCAGSLALGNPAILSTW